MALTWPDEGVPLSVREKRERGHMTRWAAVGLVPGMNKSYRDVQDVKAGAVAKRTSS